MVGKRLLPLALAALVLLAACGQNKTSGLTPAQVLRQATESELSNGFQGTYTLTLGIDTSRMVLSNVPLGIIPKSVTVTGDIDSENATHFSASARANVLGQTVNWEVRIVGSAVYTSLDGGTQWTHASESGTSVSPAMVNTVETAITGYFEPLWKSEGTATVDGATDEQYGLTLDQQVFTTLIKQVLAFADPSGATGDTALATSVVDFGAGSATVDVAESSGNITRYEVDLPMTINLAPIGTLIGSTSSGSSPGLSGSLGLTFGLTLSISTVGGETAVTAPPASSISTAGITGISIGGF